MADLRSTLFVGNLSVFCTEQDILQIFSPYGQILEIRMAKSEDSNKHLSYGFVKFSNVASAQLAMHDLKDVVLCGRPLKIGKALSRSSKKDEEDEANERQSYSTASVHVTFISHQIQRIVTEESLRFLFSRFGQVADAIICKSNVDQRQGRQSGYGFIHFSGGLEGIKASFAAAQYLEDFMIDEVNYKCKISRDLENQLKNNSVASELLLRQYHTAAKTNPTNVSQTTKLLDNRSVSNLSSRPDLPLHNNTWNMGSNNNSSLYAKQQLYPNSHFLQSAPSSIGNKPVETDQPRFTERTPPNNRNDLIATNSRLVNSNLPQGNFFSFQAGNNSAIVYSGLDSFSNNHEVFTNEFQNTSQTDRSQNQPASLYSHPMNSRITPNPKFVGEMDPRLFDMKQFQQQQQSIPSDGFSSISRPQKSIPNISYLNIRKSNSSSASSMDFLSGLGSSETLPSHPSLSNHNLPTPLQHLSQNIDYFA